MAIRGNLLFLFIIVTVLIVVVSPLRSSGRDRGDAVVAGALTGILVLGPAGAWTGAAIGSPFAGIGVVPGSLLGGAIGALAGSVVGGVGGYFGAAWIYDSKVAPAISEPS